jgi:hypothetical protein
MFCFWNRPLSFLRKLLLNIPFQLENWKSLVTEKAQDIEEFLFCPLCDPQRRMVLSLILASTLEWRYSDCKSQETLQIPYQ